MANTRGGGQTGDVRRSRRNQGLEATPSTLRAINRKPGKKRMIGIKRMTGRKRIVGEEVEDVTDQVLGSNNFNDVGDEAVVKEVNEDTDFGEKETTHLQKSGKEVADKEISDEEAAVQKELSDDAVNETLQELEKEMYEEDQLPEKEFNEIDEAETVTRDQSGQQVFEEEADGENQNETGEGGYVDVEGGNTSMTHDSQHTDAATEYPNTEGMQTPEGEGNKRKRRGPTKMRKIAIDPLAKVDVTFTDLGEHVGPGSVTLSSFLGALVREHVPVTLDDWRQLDDQSKDTMWEEIQGRFNVSEEWKKDAIFKQMGCLWRAGKSRLVRHLRDAKSSTERLELKPSNITSIPVWNSWIRSRTSSAFKVY